MFKEMQKAEHAYTKAKKLKQNFKRQQAEFKMKQPIRLMCEKEETGLSSRARYAIRRN